MALAFLSSVLQLTQQSRRRRRRHQWPLTQTLAKQQLVLLGKAARAPEASLLRTSAFRPRTPIPATSRCVRKVGRPKSEWVPLVCRMALSLLGSAATLERLIKTDTDWKSFVHSADLQNIVVPPPLPFPSPSTPPIPLPNQCFNVAREELPSDLKRGLIWSARLHSLAWEFSVLRPPGCMTALLLWLLRLSEVNETAALKRFALPHRQMMKAWYGQGGFQ